MVKSHNINKFCGLDKSTDLVEYVRGYFHLFSSLLELIKILINYNVEIRFNISIVEDLTEHMDIGSHWRHRSDLPNIGWDVRRVVDRLMRTVMRSTWESWRRRHTGCF